MFLIEQHMRELAIARLRREIEECSAHSAYCKKELDRWRGTDSREAYEIHYLPQIERCRNVKQFCEGLIKEIEFLEV